MAISVTQKAIALGLLVAAGYVLKQKFPEPGFIKTLRSLILNLALPATVFLSTLSINTNLNLALLPSFAIAINLILLIVGFGLTSWFMGDNSRPQVRTLALLFPSLAPGLTLYPFVEQFLGRDGLAWAALADVGNKLFVLVGLYMLALVWYQRSQSAHLDPPQRTKCLAKRLSQWQDIARFLVTEPVNVAIVAGLGLAFFHVAPESLPPAIFAAIDQLADCSTPLILIYIGLSLNLKSPQLGKTLVILLVRSGVGFLISAVAISLVRPAEPAALMLFVALPQTSFSLLPLLHAAAINRQAAQQIASQQTDAQALDSAEPTSGAFFDTEFATALLARSLLFSMSVSMLVFASGHHLAQPFSLSLVGIGALLICAIAWGWQSSFMRIARHKHPGLTAIALSHGF